MGVVIPNLLTEDRVSTTQIVDGSLKFDSSKSQRLRRTPSSAGNRKTFTLSVWVKRNTLDSADRDDIFTVPIGSNDNDYFQFGFYQDSLYMFGYSTLFRIVSPKYRDISGWYHLVLVADTTQADNLDRMKFYVNGIRVTNFSTNNAITQNADLGVNRVAAHDIGYQNNEYPYNGHMSQFYLIDGQALDPSYFGYTDPLTNTWRPKRFRQETTTNGSYSINRVGRIFSTGVSGSQDTDNGGGPNAAFNGSIANIINAGSYPNPGNTLTWTAANSSLGTTLPYASTARVYVRVDLNGDAGGLTVVGANGSQTISTGIAGNAYGWVNITAATSPITSIAWSRASGGSQGITLYAVEIDGQILVDNAGFGLNGFYLPFDGNSPIGQDRSGNNNNWTPVNFGGSNTLEKATGALPILNTDGGGKVARVGVRTDSNASSLVLALPMLGSSVDVSNRINSGSSTKTTTDSGVTYPSTQSNFYGSSVFFDSTDTITLSSTWFGDSSFTVEFWAYITDYGDLWTVGGNSCSFYVSSTYISIDGDNIARVNFGIASGIKIPLNKWTHFAYVKDGSSYYMFIDGVKFTTTSTGNGQNSGTWILGGTRNGYNDSADWYLQDLRYYSSAKYTQNFIPASTDPDILPDTPSGVAYSSNVTPISEGAVAFGSGRVLTTTSSADFNFGTGDFTIEYFLYRNSLGSNDAALTNYSQVSSGYFMCLHSNSTDAYLLLNGSTVTSGGTAEARKWIHYAYVRSGTTCTIYKDGISIASATSSAQAGATNVMNIGAYSDGSSFIDGFISNLHVVKGTALYTSNFTPPTAPISSVANTKLLCCKSPTSATAYDVSPGTITSVNAIASNFNPFTANINTQRGQESGYATLNPLANGNLTLSNGNLTYYRGTTDWEACLANFAMDNSGSGSGKWYFEVFCDTAAAGDNSAILEVGIALPSFTAFNNYLGTDTNSWTYQNNNGASGQKGHNNSFSTYGVSAVTGDTLGISLDLSAGGSNGVLTFYKNGISMGYAYNNLDCTKTYFPAFSAYAAGKGTANFGQKPFKFPPPSGFQPLALANTPRPGVVRPDQYVGVSTWSGAQSGSGGLTRQISTGFQPDLVWIKQRNQSYSTGHQLYDSVRGAGAEKELNPSGTAAEGAGNIETYGWLNSFDKIGFTVKGGSTDYDYVDKSGVNYVAWAWKAGGNSNTFNINDIGYSTASAAGLTGGNITPTGASINTKSGFSIIGYTGNGASDQSISHGLSKAPEFIICRSRNNATAGYAYWDVTYTCGDGSYDFLSLNTSDAKADIVGRTAPTSSLFYVNGAGSNIDSSTTYIAYLWHSVPGFSKFGTYTGNLSADGVFVHTGFKPKWILLRRVAGQWWFIYDSVRYPENKSGTSVSPYISPQSNTEGTTNSAIDFLSNGFKLRVGDNATNDTVPFIYAAFAETPSFNLYGGQSNAR